MSESMRAMAQHGAGFSSAALDSLEHLEETAGATLARTMAWSSLNSGSFEVANLALMAESLASAFSALPGKLELIGLEPFSRPKVGGRQEETALGKALRVQVRPQAALQLALTGHYDTVFAAVHPFQQVREEHGRLHGPGVADMKGGLSIMLDALLAWERSGDAGDVGYTVLLSPDEEIGSPGSAQLLAELGANARFGLTYEPATPDGFLVDARKGSGNFALVVQGRAAHVGRSFSEGRNAVAAAARFAAALDGLNGTLADVTFNVGAIEGGGVVNMVPDQALVRFNIRAPDSSAALAAEGEVLRLVQPIAAADGMAAQLHGGFSRPPKPLSPSQQAAAALVRQAGARIGLDLGFRSSGGVCEGNNLAAAGCPNIDTLGVVGGGLHSSEEWALKESFAERAKLSYSILNGISTGLLDVRSLAP